MLGKKLGTAAVDAAMKDMDVDGNGEVSFPEFKAWWDENGGKASKKSETAAGEIDLVTCQNIHTAEGLLYLEIEGRTYGRPPVLADSCTCLPPSQQPLVPVMCRSNPTVSPCAVMDTQV
jgi:hypothetical protein